MPQLNISEHDPLRYFGNDSVPALSMPPRAQQQVSIGGSSAPSAAFGSGSYLIRVHTDTACRLEFGENPTATATSAVVLSADSAIVCNVQPGQKLAVIAV
jgi:hypothetical protein